MMTAGSASLPLHQCRAPRWSFEELTKLAGEMGRVQ